MVVLGVDVHKDSHHVVGIDEAGRQLMSWSSGTRTRDCEALIARARAAFPDGRVWAVEDCRHVSGRLERALLGAGEHHRLRDQRDGQFPADARGGRGVGGHPGRHGPRHAGRVIGPGSAPWL